jgi:spore coat protein U-like protein
MTCCNRCQVAIALLIAFTTGPCLAASGTISATELNFGNYLATDSRPTDADCLVTFRCSGGSRPVTVSLMTGCSGNFARREMTGPGSSLYYNLYRDSARTVIWGDGTGGSVPLTADPGDGRVRIFGRIPARQTAVIPGVYSDSIQVTLDF